MSPKNAEPINFGNPAYGITKNLGPVDMAIARETVEAALKEEGFGILTEIDVSATLQKKIGADFRPYLILGACNPRLAHRALQAELPIGLLLPCNVVLSQEDNGDVVVSAMDPVKMFETLDRPEIAPLAQEVKAQLTKALSNVVS